MPARPLPFRRLLAGLLVLLLASPAVASAGVDRSSLPAALRKERFQAPASFKAFVIDVTFGPGRKSIKAERRYDFDGTSDDVENWNPASSVKIFAAVGALKKVRSLGFSPKARVTFHGTKDREFVVGDLVRLALQKSDNIAYDRLVQLAGFDYLHQKVFTRANGFRNVGLMRAYEPSTWTAQGENPDLRHSPAITLREGRRKKEIPAQVGDAPTSCRSAACASLQDLGECIRRIMLAEQLAPSASFGLPARDLTLLRRSMQEHPRGNEVVIQLGQAFRGRPVQFFSKPGFSQGWYSDAVYVAERGSRKAWVVVLANEPGRKCLDTAALAVGRVLAGRKLGR